MHRPCRWALPLHLRLWVRQAEEGGASGCGKKRRGMGGERALASSACLNSMTGGTQDMGMHSPAPDCSMDMASARASCSSSLMDAGAFLPTGVWAMLLMPMPMLGPMPEVPAAEDGALRLRDICTASAFARGSCMASRHRSRMGALAKARGFPVTRFR